MAWHWLRVAADAGYVPLIPRVASLLRDGSASMSVARDPEAARLYLSKAAAFGHQDSARELARLASLQSSQHDPVQQALAASASSVAGAAPGAAGAMVPVSAVSPLMLPAQALSSAPPPALISPVSASSTRSTPAMSPPNKSQPAAAAYAAMAASHSPASSEVDAGTAVLIDSPIALSLAKNASDTAPQADASAAAAAVSQLQANEQDRVDISPAPPVTPRALVEIAL